MHLSFTTCYFLSSIFVIVAAGCPVLGEIVILSATHNRQASHIQSFRHFPTMTAEQAPLIGKDSEYGSIGTEENALAASIREEGEKGEFMG